MVGIAAAVAGVVAEEVVAEEVGGEVGVGGKDKATEVERGRGHGRIRTKPVGETIIGRGGMIRRWPGLGRHQLVSF
jgi:hypothetical protein